MAGELELSDFIKTTLVQIALGVRNANEELHKSHGGKYAGAPYRLHNNIGDNKSIPGVSFDVAVTASSGTSDKAGAKISVAQIFNIGGSVEAKSNDTYLHRIKFVVGVHTDWD
jgi:hypothetical protein